MSKRFPTVLAAVLTLALVFAIGTYAGQGQKPKNQNQQQAQQGQPNQNKNGQQGQQQPAPKKEAQQGQKQGQQKPAPQKNAQQGQKNGGQQKPAPQAQPKHQTITLTGLSDMQSREVYQTAQQHAFFQLDYDALKRPVDDRTRHMEEHQYMQKTMPDGTKRILLLGLNLYAAQHNELLIWGQTTKNGKVTAANPDMNAVTNVAKQAAENAGKMQKKFSPHELQLEFYQLSYTGSQQAVQVLQTLGYNVGQPKNAVTLNQLPLVWPAPQSNRASVATGKEGTTQPLKEPTEVAPMHRVAFLYHRSQGEQVLELKRLLDEKIDLPARQVLIESMVLEITEDGMRELGVEWNWRDRVGEVSGDFDPTQDEGLSLNFDDYRGKTSNILKARLKALIQEQQAEILSSPSVLALNNSQATIRVGRRVPLIRTLLPRGEFFAKVDIEFEKVGITLNIKPRVSQAGDMVAMQIQTEVSEVREWITHEDRRVAPVIATRNVQTLAHVKNNTPFIIGGLIRNESRNQWNRLPVLSAIPVLGGLFQKRSTTNEKREDIIVLTPRVLEPLGPNRPILPKDTKRFDFMNNKLFRNSYRLKSEDVFDLGFIKENEQIQSTFARAREFANEHPDVSGKPPFDALGQSMLPGEDAVVIRMLYEIVKKLELYERVKLENLIYFQEDPEKPAGFDVEFLEGKLHDIEAGEPFFENSYPKKVLVLRYDLKPGSELTQITETPVAEMEVKTVQNRDEVEELWQQENRIPEDNYHADQAVLVLDSRDDIVRLKTAILVREIINVNDAILSVKNFRVGRKIVIPQLQKANERIFLIDHNVARYHYMTEFYYSAFRNKLKRYYDGLREIFRAHGGA